MLQVALAGLLAGSLALSPPDGTGDAKKTPNADKPAAESVATPGVFETAAQGPLTITQDTYAFGVPADAAPIKIWASYAYGKAEQVWDRRGEDNELEIAGTNGDILSQRINVGAQINFISFPAFKLGGGGQLTVAKNRFDVGEDGDPLSIGDIESDFGLQGVKVYGTLRGRTLGLHGGYIFDLGDERETRAQALPNGATVDLPTTLSTSDGRDAVFFGADFDVPSDRYRVFGGIDYFILQNSEAEAEEDFEVGTDLLNFMFGAGVKLSVFEVGAALQIQTRFNSPIVENISTASGNNAAGIGSHAGTVSPYIRISPPSLPVSLFVKGAVQDEYTDFGYAIGGANSVQPTIGFTAGLTVGFE